MEAETYWLNKIQEILRDSEDRVITMEECKDLKHYLSRIVLSRYGMTQVWFPWIVEGCREKVKEYFKHIDENSVI